MAEPFHRYVAYEMLGLSSECFSGSEYDSVWYTIQSTSHRGEDSAWAEANTWCHKSLKDGG